MIEHQEDKLEGLKLEWKSREKINWTRMKEKIKLFDPIEGKKNYYGSIWYTWCNFQQGRRRIYCRLDRVYANKNFSP